MLGHEDKATRYVALLDSARVNGSWTELPELIRKVNKHAPNRKVLINTATAEHQVAVSPARPSSSAGSDLTTFTTLSDTLQSQSNHEEEDCVQARTCLLWARWVNAVQRTTLPAPQASTDAISRLYQSKDSSTWTKICLVKSAYIDGTSQIQSGRTADAQRTFRLAVDAMQANRELVLSIPQLAYWSEQLLAQLALSGDEHEPRSAGSEAVHLEAFRYWSIIATKTNEASASVYKNSSAHLPRAAVWPKYYHSLSSRLKSGVDGTASSSNGGRLLLSTELRKVERAYENEFSRSTKFPKASESNQLVEQWVEQAIRNWQTLCGPDWRDAELGDGGRNTVARDMLDILYRAAMKTFHSTLILRRLFQVHKSLTEFDLAYKALDTYIELVERARSRAAKSGQAQPGQESDESVLLTVSEGVEGLCSFGNQPEARKAYELCIKLEGWLDDINVGDHNGLEMNGTQQNGNDSYGHRRSPISTKTLELTHRAIGIGKAHWARWTPFSEHRLTLQEEALMSLKRACLESNSGDTEMETYYATGLLLAETRQIEEAIDFVKRALARGTSSSSETVQWSTARKSVPLWHLLALLLSSRDDYENAAKSCVAAFEQFPSTSVLFGHRDKQSGAYSEEKNAIRSPETGLVTDMECDELKRMIETRITELALTELTEGPEDAVNCSNELLGLFSRLFAHLQVSLETPVNSRVLVPPKSSAGTVKSMKGSIFSRRKHNSSVEPISEKPYDNMSMLTSTTRPGTQATQAPTIQVTDEEGKSPSGKRHLFRHSHDKSARNSRTSFEGSTKKLVHHHSQRGHSETPVNNTNHDSGILGNQSRTLSNQNDDASAATVAAALPEPIVALDHAKSAETRQELDRVEHNLGSHDNMPPPASHDRQPPEQDVRLPTLHPFTNATSPIPRFAKAAAQRQAFTVLAKIWLTIATLYRRASMFEDAKEACEEASRAVSKIESLAGAVDQSARALAEPGWGCGEKSVDEIWADIYCKRAELQLAVHERRIQEGQESPKEGGGLRFAVEEYEQCLMYYPNHASGIIGLSNVLLDYYEKKIDLAQKVDDGRPKDVETARQSSDERPGLHRDVSEMSNGNIPAVRNGSSSAHSAGRTEKDLRKTPENLNRIAARDRAYGLLSTLTKLGSGWDNSEAWFALARAHELGGEVEKAKSILWWCIELEDTKPVRSWRNLGYVI